MLGQVTSEITRSYNSFSGSDIRAVIGPYHFAELQALSYSISREKAPVYTMGSCDPRSYSRNKRGIAGTCVWINFDRHALLNIIHKAKGTFIANRDDVRPEWNLEIDQYNDQKAAFQSTLIREVGPDIGATIDEIGELNIQGDTVSGFKMEAAPFYSDQILPFDITLAGTNENGAATACKIFAVEILSEGNGISIDDSVSEMQCTWVARGIEPWMAVQNNFRTTGSGRG